MEDFNLYIGEVKQSGSLKDNNIIVNIIGYTDNIEEEKLPKFQSINLNSYENFEKGEYVLILSTNNFNYGWILCKCGNYSTDENTLSSKALEVLNKFMENYSGYGVELELSNQLKVFHSDKNMLFLYDKQNMKTLIFYPSNPQVLFYISPDKIILCNRGSRILMTSNSVNIKSDHIILESNDIQLGNSPNGYLITGKNEGEVQTGEVFSRSRYVRA